MKLTKLRRIEGDVNVLRDDLQQALGMDQKEVVINQLTKQIIVKVFRLGSSGSKCQVQASGG